jgi:hypothetical protein
MFPVECLDDAAEEEDRLRVHGPLRGSFRRQMLVDERKATDRLALRVRAKEERAYMMEPGRDGAMVQEQAERPRAVLFGCGEKRETMISEKIRR